MITNFKIKDFFKDKHGKTVTFQPPNLLIIVFIAAKILDFIFDGTIGQLFSLIAFGAIFTWAWLEIFMGASPFRRVLGAVVMGAVLFYSL